MSDHREPICFEWVEIEGFRGFAERRRFEMNASVVILSGTNGTGKTSFFDAVQWNWPVLTDTVRLACASRERMVFVDAKNSSRIPWNGPRLMDR